MPLNADDHSEIMMLAGRYSQGVDLGEVETWRSVWTDDAIMEMESAGMKLSGNDLWAVPANHDPAAPQTRHRASSFVIDGDGDAATMSSYVTVVIVPAADDSSGDPARVGFHGRYQDELRRVDGAWKIAHRKIIADWMPD